MKPLILKFKNDPRIKNSLWMLIEKGISLFGLIFVVSAVAKYTGPKIYGEISLAASIFIVSKTLAQLGLDQIFFKYVSSSKPYYNIFFIQSIKIMSFFYFIISFIVLLFSYLYSSYTGMWFIVATSISYYFNTIDLVNYYNEAKLLSKINVFANIIGLFFALTLRYVIVFFKLNVLFLCAPIVLMTLIPFLIKIHFYLKYHSYKSKKYKKNNWKKYFIYILLNGLPLTFSILTIALNSQVANYFLAYFETTESVALYSVAFVLAGAWCIIPTTFIMSYMTTIYNSNKFDSYVILSAKLLNFILLLSLFIVLTLYFFGAGIIELLYGDEYYKSIVLFKIMIFVQFFWVINFYFSKLIIKFNGYKFLAYKGVVCCTINIVITYLMIWKYSVIGAAYALLISEFISLILNLFYKKANILTILLCVMKLKRA